MTGVSAASRKHETTGHSLTPPPPPGPRPLIITNQHTTFNVSNVTLPKRLAETCKSAKSCTLVFRDSRFDSSNRISNPFFKRGVKGLAM